MQTMIKPEYEHFEDLKRGYLFAKLLNDEMNKKVSEESTPFEEQYEKKQITDEELINKVSEIMEKYQSTETLELMLEARRALITESARIMKEKCSPSQWEQIKDVYTCTLPSIREKLVESTLHFDPSLPSKR